MISKNILPYFSKYSRTNVFVDELRRIFDRKVDRKKAADREQDTASDISIANGILYFHISLLASVLHYNPCSQLLLSASNGKGAGNSVTFNEDKPSRVYQDLVKDNSVLYRAF